MPSIPSIFPIAGRIVHDALHCKNPYQKSLIYKIEMIQRRAARWVFSNYNFHSSVSSMLKDLNWSTLEERQKTSRLTPLSRIVHHQEPAIQMPQYFLPQTSTTRQFHQLHHHHAPNIIKNAFFTELLKNGMSCHHLVMTNSWTNIYKSIYIIGCISAHCCLSNII